MLTSQTLANYRTQLRKLRKVYEILPEGEQKQKCWATMLKLADKCGMEVTDPKLDVGPGRPRVNFVPTTEQLNDVTPKDGRTKFQEQDPEKLKWIPGTPEYDARLKRIEARKAGKPVDVGKLDEEILTAQADREAKEQDEVVRQANEALTGEKP